MNAEKDLHGFLRTLRSISDQFECSLYELIMGANYLDNSDRCRVLLLAASQ